MWFGVLCPLSIDLTRVKFTFHPSGDNKIDNSLEINLIDHICLSRIVFGLVVMLEINFTALLLFIEIAVPTGGAYILAGCQNRLATDVEQSS